jgi:hypothetical protein
MTVPLGDVFADTAYWIALVVKRDPVPPADSVVEAAHRRADHDDRPAGAGAV